MLIGFFQCMKTKKKNGRQHKEKINRTQTVIQLKETFLSWILNQIYIETLFFAKNKNKNKKSINK